METLHPLYDKKIACALCSHSFYSKKVRSRFLKAQRYDTDFFIYYENPKLHPIIYDVVICPKCGYASTEQFSRIFPPGSANQVKEKVTKNWSYQPYDQERTLQQAINAYKLAIYCANIKKEKSSVLASLTLRVSWLYRLLDDIQQERAFALHALKCYTTAYLEETFPSNSNEVRLLYIIGELNYRLGFQQQALLYFSEIIYKHKNHPDRKTFERTKERWHEIRSIS
ncbi:hypothetical protein A2U94_09670 [Bacillus sp. VT 712]|uniref:DUF2225 domain-containing protein n=1 Tax=Priestia veravalensis TaxID=1414648 RepID=A0A0V8JAI2_9BACI|nr:MULTISPECIES: DUF2225 domain-containing protein [Bacillaceae]KSU83973.1 hypothetical protein AS180_21170 [Priestia veravalensis]KZB91740.1 hypothetical protein A2U94_09670 [Bacillus sp. VT 712]WHX78818.1 DUF2225 domain-containing protein [Priestia flexa]SCC60096.1 hypothetical protein GA0061087_11313 [Priestia flexa]